MATMGTGRWTEKIEVYREYPRTQHFKDTFKAQWCIVLAVAPSAKRIMSLAEKTAGTGDQRGFWFATADQLTPDTALSRVWVRASDLFGSRNETVVKLSEYSKATRSALPDALR